MTRVSGHIWILLLFVFAGCLPPDENKPEAIEFKYSWNDPVVRHIYDLEIDQSVDSMAVYAKHKQPGYRYGVAKSLASIRDERSLDILMPLLKDSVPQVAQAAAIAIGQVGEVSAVNALMNAFRSDDSLGIYKRVNSAILEATGRCGEQRALELLSFISTYTPSDTFLVYGQAAGIYRLMLRNYQSAQGTGVMAKFVGNANFPKSVRTLAASYFYRARNVDLSDYTYTFKRILEEDRNPHVRMGIATVLARYAATSALPGITEVVLQDADYRVKVNYIRGLGNRRVSELELEIRANIKKYPYPLQRVAAGYILQAGHEEGSIGYWDMARVSGMHYETVDLLAAAAARHLPFYYSITRQQVGGFLKSRYLDARDIYQKQSALNALAIDPDNALYIVRQAQSAEDPLLQSAIATSLVSLYDENKDRVTPAEVRSLKRQVFPAAYDLLLKGDPGASATLANFIRSNWDDAKAYVNDQSAIEALMKGLELPAHLETYNSLAHLVATMEGVGFIPQKSTSVKTLDWQAFDALPDKPVATIKTDKGTFEMTLYPNVAPLTVMNFVELSTSGYFNDKIVHRVVPNFVIQTGCPRGDGYGSLDYTIRSELFGPDYDKEGYVGMASAGNHTECSQWFVTHSPTHHLDGNYTIFGAISRGMNVIHEIEVGDKIVSVSIK